MNTLNNILGYIAEGGEAERFTNDLVIPIC